VNFKNVLQLARRKPPFGIAQIGKSFRNEITPGNFLFRTREFEQMEMEYFVPPDKADQWYEYWVKERFDWYTRYDIRESHLRLRRAGRRRATTAGPAFPSADCAGKGRSPPPDREGREDGHEGPGAVRGAPPPSHRRVRRQRSDRPALPPPGRDRDAVRVHDRRADARGRHRHRPGPRLA